MSRRLDVLTFRGQEIEIPGVDVRNIHHPKGMNLAKTYPKSVHGKFGKSFPDGLCFHDSVTDSAPACFHALGNRQNAKGEIMGLGTGLIVGPGGGLYQIVPDLDTVTWHASNWSAYKIGVDVASLVDPKLAPNSPLRRPKTSWTEARGYLDYTEPQKRTLKIFAPILCEAIGAPFDCPREKDGRPATRGYGKGPVRGLVPGQFKGCIGHAQVSKARWDANRCLEILFGAPTVA